MVIVSIECKYSEPVHECTIIAEDGHIWTGQAYTKYGAYLIASMKAQAYIEDQIAMLRNVSEKLTSFRP